MKLRIENQNVRFRLSTQDIDRLERDGRLDETLSMTPLAAWSYAIEASDARQPRVEAEGQSFKILLPREELTRWMNSADIDWHFTVDGLDVDVEKDLKPRRH